MSTKSYSIGDLSRLTGCKIPTIRYYEATRLIDPVERTTGGHRMYDDGALRDLGLIRAARDLGFGTEAIHSLLQLRRRQGEACAEVDAIAGEHLVSIEEKIDQLLSFRTFLKSMLEDCEKTTIDDCRIINGLVSEGMMQPLNGAKAGGVEPSPLKSR